MLPVLNLFILLGVFMSESNNMTEIIDLQLTEQHNSTSATTTCSENMCPNCGASIRDTWVFDCGSNRPNRVCPSYVQSDACRIRVLETTNKRLRKILAFVPARIVIAAKEAAGFGDIVRCK